MKKLKTFVMSEEKLTMKFGGSEDIDMETLSISLNSTLMALKAIAMAETGEEDFCKFKVKDVRHGSFDIDIVQITNAINVLNTFIPTAAGIMTIYVGILTIRNHNAGKKPKDISVKDGKAEITNDAGEKITVNAEVLNVYMNNKEIEDSSAEMMKAISADPSRTDLEIEHKAGRKVEKVTYKHDNISAMSTRVPIETIDDIHEQSNSRHIMLSVIKPDLVGDTKWIVSNADQKMPVVIKDEDFLDGVHNNEISFNGATVLEADLLTEVVKSSNGKIYDEKTKYTVTKIYKIHQKKIKKNKLNL